MTAAPARVSAVIVGTGFGGLAMAIQLKKAGFHDLVLLEKADAIGGTWRDNHYPGAACDVPAHLYSFSFAPNPDWSCAFAPQPEIRAYMERVVDQFAIRPHVRLHTRVTSAELDESRALWTVRAADGRCWQADIVVAATGGLSRPLVPTLPGLEHFAGRTWHSARWDHDFDLRGQRVAVVGTGASAIQFVPRIQPQVATLHLLQRTPAWVLPRPDHDFSDDEKRRFRSGPRRWLHRQALYWRHELRAIPFTLEPRILRLAERMAVKNLERHVADPVLRRKLTPSYRMGCKRILMSNDYYPALARPNVEVVTDGIREVTARGVVVDDGSAGGRELAVDAIAFGTGFDVHDYLGPITVVGRGGQELGARWRHSAEAYLGTTVPGFPNFFTVIGPNTGLGHNSIIVMIESQVRHIMACLAGMRAHGAALIEPRADVTRRYNDELQRRLARTVWATGCASWYRDASGKNTTLWPGLTAEFAVRTWRFDPRAYAMQRRDQLPRAVPRLARDSAA